MKSHQRKAATTGGRSGANKAKDLVRKGLAAHESGDPGSALESYLEALASSPGHPDALCLGGAALIQLGRSDEAVTMLQDAVKAGPKNVAAWTNYGTALQNTGRNFEAQGAFEKALRLDPGCVDAHFNRGNLYLHSGQLHESVAEYRAVLASDPTHPEALTNLANVLYDLGDYMGSLGTAQKAISAKSRNAKAMNVYGLSLAALGHGKEAADAFRSAVHADPGNASAYSNLAHTYLDMGFPAEALEASIQAVQLRPNSPEAHCSRANALRDLGQIDGALGACKTALDLNPKLPDAHNCLANLHLDLGQPEQAVRSYRRALDLKPDYREIASNIVMATQYMPHAGPGAVLEEARSYARSFASVENARPKSRAAVQRIGFVSPDLWNHPVARFLDPLLAHLGASGVAAYVYSNSARSDKQTESLAAHTQVWRKISGIDAYTVAELVREDDIDVLVDLAGHTAGNSLDVFAARPAATQVTWLGFSGTTGLNQIDAIIGDKYVTPKTDDMFYSEKVVRLDSPWLCFAPPVDLDVQVSSPPHEKGNPFTFGCLNHSKKVSRELVATWAMVMRLVPGSRIVLKSRAYASASARKQYLSWFEENGIGMERIVFLGATSWAAHFMVHNQIDILLDPFPYNGATTTVEGLWMGVPVVTLESPGFASRMSGAILRHIGCPDLVARSVGDYVEMAAGLAADIEKLRGLRAELRSRLHDSPLCDAAGFAKAFVKGVSKV